MASFKIVLSGVNNLAAALGAPVKFQQIGIWSRDYQDPRDLWISVYHRPQSPTPAPGGILEAAEGLELVYDSITLSGGEIAFCGGWVLHKNYGYILATLARDFPAAVPYGSPLVPTDGDIWEWNIAANTLYLKGALVKGSIGDILYLEPQTGTWQPAPPKAIGEWWFMLYTNQRLGLRVPFGNIGSIPQNMRLDMVLTPPDYPDHPKALAVGQAHSLDPGQGAYQEFYNDPPLQVGTYNITLSLLAEAT